MTLVLSAHVASARCQLLDMGHVSLRTVCATLGEAGAHDACVVEIGRWSLAITDGEA